MMLDATADRERCTIIMRGTFKTLMDQVVLWMENERIQNRGKYSHPRDRIPGRTVIPTRSPAVAFSIIVGPSEENLSVTLRQREKPRGRTVSRAPSHRDRSRSLSMDSRDSRRVERRRSASTSLAESNTRSKAQRNYKAQSSRQGAGAKYDSRLDSKAPANKCEYCSLVHKHDAKRLQWITNTL